MSAMALIVSPVRPSVAFDVAGGLFPVGDVVLVDLVSVVVAMFSPSRGFVLGFCLVWLPKLRERGFVAADANRLFDSADKDFSVSNLSGSCTLYDCGDGRHGFVIGYDDLQFDFGQKIHRVFAATEKFGVTFLPTEASHFSDRHALNANVSECISDFLQFVWLTDRFDFLHAVTVSEVV